MGIFSRKPKEDDSPGVDLTPVDESRGERGQILDRGTIEFITNIAPELFVVEEDHVRVGEDYCRTLYIMTYPPQTQDDWLRPIFRFPEALTVSMFIQPLDSKDITSKLRRKISTDQARMEYEMEQGSQTNFRIQQRLQDTMELVQLIDQNITRPFQVSLLMTVRARTKEELDRITVQLERTISSSATTRKATLKHKDGYLSTLPILQNYLADSYSVKNIHTQGLQTFFPLTAADLTHETGVLIGVNVHTTGNVIVDRFKQPEVPNPGMLVFGTSGSGKSYFAKSEMSQWRMLGIPVIVIDPQNEYERLCAWMKGSFITLSESSQHKINPMDFAYAVHPEENALGKKIAFLIELIQSMLRSGRPDQPPLSDRQRSLLDQALREMYNDVYGYSNIDISTQLQATPQNMPTLSDLHDYLQRMQQASKDRAYSEALERLVEGLRPYVGSGSLAGLFDHKTTVGLNNPFIVFNIQQVEDAMMPVVMQLVLEFLRTSLFTVRQARSGVSRLLYVDEAQRLMKFPETAAFLEHVAKTARKFNVGFTALTQDADAFLLDENNQENKFGKGILNNCSTVMLLKQSPQARDVIKNTFKLTDNEVLTLGAAGTGEGIIFVSDERAWVSMYDMVSPMAHQMFTTTPSEVHRIYTADAQMGMLPQTTGGNTPANNNGGDFRALPPGPGRTPSSPYDEQSPFYE